MVDTRKFILCLILIVLCLNLPYPIVSLTLNLPILDPAQDTSEMGTVTDLVLPRGACVTTLKLFPWRMRLFTVLCNVIKIDGMNKISEHDQGNSLRVAVPTPGGKTEGRSLPPVFPRGVGTATRRLHVLQRFEFIKGHKGLYRNSTVLRENSFFLIFSIYLPCLCVVFFVVCQLLRPI